MRDGITDAQSCQRISFAESAGDDQIRILRLQRQRGRPFRRIDEFGIGLVDNDHDIRRHVRHERGEVVCAVPGAGGVIGIGEINQPRRGRDRSGDRVESVAAGHRVAVCIARRDPQRRARALRGDGVDRKTILRRNHVDTGAGKHLRALHQQFMRTVAQHDGCNIDAMLRGQRTLEVGAERIGIAKAVVDGGEDRLFRAWTGTVRVFVRAEFDEMPPFEATPECGQIVAGIVGAKRLDARSGERGEESFVGHERLSIWSVAHNYSDRNWVPARPVHGR